MTRILFLAVSLLSAFVVYTAACFAGAQISPKVVMDSYYTKRVIAAEER